MENAQTKNSAAGGASALTDVLERMRARADDAYCDYIGQLRRDECLGWEIKVERQKFGEAELKAHCAAAEKLGRHRALHEAAKMLEETLRSKHCASNKHMGTTRKAHDDFCALQRAIRARGEKGRQAAESDPNASWLTEAHILCSDNGIPHGNITERIRALRDKLEQAATPTPKVYVLHPDDPAIPHLPDGSHVILQRKIPKFSEQAAQQPRLERL